VIDQFAKEYLLDDLRHETRAEVTGRYRRACEHSDATISALPIVLDLVHDE
jgi:hypothetical protein